MTSPTSPIFQGIPEPFEETGVFEGHNELDNRPQRNTSSKSFWRKKSANKSPITPHLSLITMDAKAIDSSDDEPDHIPFPSSSIIPDPLRELPSWYKQESDLAAARLKYPLHNPVGPKWYKNHHLAILNPSNRPPSLFSPSFPPMTPSLLDSQDSPRLPPPTRSPSATTLQTLASSQVRIPDPAAKPRSRKTSQDNADLLDASDPWGTCWHHQSPYDTASNIITPLTLDSPDRSRSRLSSMNVPTRHKTVIPSPLSQSTSALTPQPPQPTVTRKLSKQRKPVLAHLFGAHDKAPDSTTSNSAPPHRALTITGTGSSLQVPDTSPRRNSTSIPPSASTAALSTHSSTTKDRRTSVLGRLVRKFSILKKSTQDPGPTISERAENDLQEGPSRRSFVSRRQPSTEKPSMESKHSDPSKRIPPPRVDSEPTTQTANGRGPSTELEREILDHRSSISYEVPFSPGKLTIANPDAPSSGGSTPIRISIALPSEDSPIPQFESNHHVIDTPQPRPAQSRQEYNANRESMSPTSPQSNGKISPVKRVSPVPASSSLPPISSRSNGKTSPVKRVNPVPVLSSPPPVVRSEPNVHVQSPPFLPYPSFGPSVSITTPASFISAPATAVIHAYSIATSTPDDSPLSKASLLVNPPTPYDYDTSELLPDSSTDVPNVVQIEKVPGKAPSQEHSPFKKGSGEVIRVAKSNSTTSRKTETFRLMRNPSDKASGETITVEGEHWTIVNSSDAPPRRRRTKEKVEKNERVERVERQSSSTKDRESRKEQRRLEKAAQEAAENHRRATSQGRTNAEADDSASERPPRSRSFDTAPRSSVVQPMVFTLHGEPPRHRKSDDRPRDSYYQQAQPKPTRPSPVSGIAHVERLPSTATRPTSEMTSAADINALRAREAWEMDRLWKGRSMYHGHPEVNVISSPPNARDSRHVNGEFVVDVPGHGSSHTSYLVQPLQAHPMPASVFYANMPSAPPPIIYTTTSPYGQVLHQGGNQPSNRSLSNSFAFPSTENPSSNPLPRPPRQSTYQPVHLPILSDRGSSAAVSDYWTNNKYPPVPSH